MRIAISVESSNGLDSTVAHHFGRCPYFALVDLEGNKLQAIEVIDNPYFSGHQVGEVPKFIHDQNADMMLSGGMGGRAIQFFKDYGIGVATGATGTVESTLGNYLAGGLREAAPCSESVAHGHGHDH